MPEPCHILVTGGAGQIGLELQRAIWPELVVLHAPSRDELDLTSSESIQVLFDKVPFTAVINSAAWTAVDKAEAEVAGAFAANAGGPALLADITRERGIPLVHVSTDYVFDGEAGPYAIDAKPNPRGTYAITKHAGEQTAKALLPASQWTIARTAVVFGWPSTGKNNFGFWLVSTLAQGKQVPLFEDQWVSTSHATNVAAMVKELAEKKLAGLWHTCGAEVMDRVSFGLRVCERFGFDQALVKPSRMADVKLASPRPAKSGLDVTKTAQKLDAKPWTVARALDELYRERQEHPS